MWKAKRNGATDANVAGRRLRDAVGTVPSDQDGRWRFDRLRMRSDFAAAETRLRLLIELTYRPFKLLLVELGVKEPAANRRGQP